MDRQIDGRTGWGGGGGEGLAISPVPGAAGDTNMRNVVILLLCVNIPFKSWNNVYVIKSINHFIYNYNLYQD